MSNEVREIIDEFSFIDTETMDYMKDNAGGLNYFTFTIGLFSIAITCQFLYCLINFYSKFSYSVAILSPTITLGLTVMLRYLSYKEYKRLEDIREHAKYFKDPIFIRNTLNYEFHKENRKGYRSYAFITFTSTLLMYGVVLVKYLFSL